MVKVYMTCRRYHSAKWLGKIQPVDNIEDSDVVMFSGGEDINPKLYQQPAHYSTSFNVRRDKAEVKDFRKAIELGKPIIGICRGSQLACVMAGGDLIQDMVDAPSFDILTTSDGDEGITITSCHHQAQDIRPLVEGEDVEVLAWTKGVSPYHKDGWDKDIPVDREIEIAYYSKINALAIQGHPEWMTDKECNPAPVHKKTFDYLNRLIQTKLKLPVESSS